MLPDDWCSVTPASPGMGVSADGHVRFTSTQAALLDAWLATQPDVTVRRDVRRAAQALDSGRRTVDPPPTFRGTCATISATRWRGSSSCGSSDSAGVWPTNGARQDVMVLAALEARRRTATAENPAAVLARRRAAIARLQLAARGGALRAQAARPRLTRGSRVATRATHRRTPISSSRRMARCAATSAQLKESVRLRGARRSAGHQERSTRRRRRRGC